jgi:hypothetical protein
MSWHIRSLAGYTTDTHESSFWKRQGTAASAGEAPSLLFPPSVLEVHDMPTWREDALKGATAGALIFLGVALLFGAAYWLF